MNYGEFEEVMLEQMGERVGVARAYPVGGGCIGGAHRVELTGGGVLFVKEQAVGAKGVLEAEARGLALLAEAEKGTIRVPRVMGYGAAGGSAFLATEWIDLRTRGDAAALGRGLAMLHRNQADAFGLEADNFIGMSPQANSWETDWIQFYRDRRLGPQYEMALRRGVHLPGMVDVLENLSLFFADYSPVPSLLHGDLWGGNAAFSPTGEPVLFDPAVYYGDHEADWAMMELFGGFERVVWEAYQKVWPMHCGYQTGRRELYQLYHILNHFNLFGGGYAAQAKDIVAGLIRRIDE